jgi:hypothetical protein
MEGADQQYFIALDKNTGKTLWRRDRSTVYNDEKNGGFERQDYVEQEKYHGIQVKF